MIIASVIGAEINAAVRFEIPGYEDSKPPYPRDLALMDHCCIYPECDVLPCLNEISFVNPDMRKRRADRVHTASPSLSGQPPMAMIPVTRLSADGCVPFMLDEDFYCCPPPLCGNDLCCTFVAFMNLLPSGPLWDYWKAQAISYFESNPEEPAECPLLKDPACPSLVLHSIYTVLKLRTSCTARCGRRSARAIRTPRSRRWTIIWRGCNGKTATTSTAAACCWAR